MKEKRSQNNSRRAASGKLAEIFTKINMSELPAMSPHVQELLALTRDRKAGAYELSEVILKDYSLTNKILQMVNSAYYGLNQQISSISRAVTILGFDTVKNMATGIAIFEDFVKSGVEQDGIVRLITKSFLSGLLARDIADNRRLNVLPEEAFICSLLHNLGKIIVYIYFPDIHRAFEEKISQGMDEDGAARSLLENMSLPEVGVELARFWNMSEKIIMAMDVEPAPPMSTFDEDGNIRCLADFSNRIIGEICTIGDITSSFAKYGKMFSLKERDVLIFLKNTIEEAQNVSSVVRKGMAGLKIRARILHLEERVKRRKKIVAQGPAIEEAPSEFDIADDKIQQDKDGKADLSADDFIRDITNSLLSEFTLNDIYSHIIEGLYVGVGFDRVLLATVKKKGDLAFLVGRQALGDIDAIGLETFVEEFTRAQNAIGRAMNKRIDMALPPNTPNAFPQKLEYLAKDRMIYLLPVIYNYKPVGLFYLDRHVKKPKLTPREIKTVRLFRDFALMAIKKIRSK